MTANFNTDNIDKYKEGLIEFEKHLERVKRDSIEDKKPVSFCKRCSRAIDILNNKYNISIEQNKTHTVCNICYKKIKEEKLNVK
jgi:hypothetical protein